MNDQGALLEKKKRLYFSSESILRRLALHNVFDNGLQRHQSIRHDVGANLFVVSGQILVKQRCERRIDWSVDFGDQKKSVHGIEQMRDRVICIVRFAENLMAYLKVNN